MEALANLFVATTELVEAEGRSLRRQIIRVSTAIGMVFIACLLAILGIASVMYGLFGVLSEQLSTPVAAFCVGFVAVLLAGGLACTASRMMK